MSVGKSVWMNDGMSVGMNDGMNDASVENDASSFRRP